MAEPLERRVLLSAGGAVGSQSNLSTTSLKSAILAGLPAGLTGLFRGSSLHLSRTPVGGNATPQYVLNDPSPQLANGSLAPFSTAAPTGLTPSQVRQAYGIGNIKFGSITGDGTGQTIAIVDAYDDPSAASDLQAFDAYFGLAAPPSFTKVNETGGTSLPGTDPAARGNDWEVEETLDIEWAHVIAPKASIVLVEAAAPSRTSLIQNAVGWARNAPGVSAVSMSFGGAESSTDPSSNSLFTTPAGHTGVTFVASTGDSGSPGGFPAYSPNVVAVGGTTLSVDASGNYQGESGWSGSGGGVSTYENQPTYQQGVVTQSSQHRTIPDVALDADPNSGVPIYDTYDFGAGAPWVQVGGTSLAAPLFAGLTAVADQGRVLNGSGTLDGATQTLPKLYSVPYSNFHDVSSGSNGYSAGPGYDLVTGLGSPIANTLVPALVGSALGSISGSSTAASSSYNLTTLGTSDWAHWGRNATYGNFDHKASGGSQISNVSVVGTGANYGGYLDSSRSVTWTDGTPTASDTNEDGYIWSNGALNTGYSFTVPADTTTRTLTVYAGGINTTTSLTAHLSDGSAADMVLTAGKSGLYANAYTFTYHAASAGQTLTITLLKTGNLVGTSGSADLIAASLVGGAVADTTPPTATLQPPSPITSPTSASETLTVVYTDNVAVKASTLATGNLTISGPIPETAQFVSASPAGNAPTITATYNVGAPAGGWTATANGAYTVSLASGSVSDSTGNFAAAATLGTFQVNIPTPGGGSLGGSTVFAAASYNLTSLGTSDWAHWGRGGVYGNFDHKASGGSQISNVTVVGSGASCGGYADPSRSVTWTDGTPTSSDINEQGYIWSNGALNTGYSFTVPADTTTRTLTVYAGGINTYTSLTAHLSDGSAADYVAYGQQAGLASYAYTFTYHAASAGQTLTLTLLKTGNINRTDGSADLIAAYLTGAPVADTTPPTAVLQPVAPIVSANASATITVVYSDNVAVKRSTLANQNITVGSLNQLPTFVSASSSVDGPNITATYTLAAPSGGWTTAYDGTYAVNLSNGSISDTSGNFAKAGSLGTLQIAIPVPGAGSLAGTSVAAASSYNLTALGGADWAHWGRNSSYGNFDHKAAGGSQISNVTIVGSGANYGGYSDSSRNATWTDGTPAASDSSEHGYIWSNGALNTGYSFTVPAGTTAHTLSVYAGGNNVNTSLTAHLSDGSAADVTLSAGQSGLYTNLYTITFKAASAGQTLKITLLKTGNIVGTNGSADLIAAYLN